MKQKTSSEAWDDYRQEHEAEWIRATQAQEVGWGDIVEEAFFDGWNFHKNGCCCRNCGVAKKQKAERRYHGSEEDWELIRWELAMEAACSAKYLCEDDKMSMVIFLEATHEAYHKKRVKDCRECRQRLGGYYADFVKMHKKDSKYKDTLVKTTIDINKSLNINKNLKD